MKKLAIVVATSTLLLSGMTYAGAQTGLVFGANVGMGEFTNKLSPSALANINLPQTSPDDFQVENGNVNFGATIGYDLAIPNIVNNMTVGAEIGVNYTPNIGSYSYNAHNETAKIEANSLQIPFLLTTKYYIGNFNVAAKAGYTYVRQNTTVKDNSTPTPSSALETTNTKFKPMIALGVGYEVMDNLAITAQYSWQFGNSANDSKYYDANGAPTSTFATYTVTAGMTYTLPM